MLEIQYLNDREQWNTSLEKLPYAHVLQTWEWGDFKHTTTGWEPKRIAFLDDGNIVAMASIGIRSMGPFKVAYIPKGPVLDYTQPELVKQVLSYLEKLARDWNTIWLKIDPDVVTGTGIPETDDAQDDPVGKQVVTQLDDWRYSQDQVQFRNTITFDLQRDLDDVLMNMSQNTRRKVRTAEKKEVTIREGTADDLEILYDLYRITGERDDFLTRPFSYYQLAWKSFIEAGLAQPLIAEHNGKAIAHVILFHFASTCWYLYGASSNEERNRMPNYALQWEAMKWAKAHEYKTYDMWGAPDVFDESDRMWGVYQFKQGFRGTVTRHIGAWDYVPNTLLYNAYTRLIPAIRGMFGRFS